MKTEPVAPVFDEEKYAAGVHVPVFAAVQAALGVPDAVHELPLILMTIFPVESSELAGTVRTATRFGVVLPVFVTGAFIAAIVDGAPATAPTTVHVSEPPSQYFPEVAVPPHTCEVPNWPDELPTGTPPQVPGAPAPTFTQSATPFGLAFEFCT